MARAMGAVDQVVDGRNQSAGGRRGQFRRGTCEELPNALAAEQDAEVCLEP